MVPDPETAVKLEAITLYEAIQRTPTAGRGTGIKCNCKGPCNTNTCTCRKNNVRCGSKCHSKRECENKNEYLSIV